MAYNIRRSNPCSISQNDRGYQVSSITMDWPFNAVIANDKAPPVSGNHVDPLPYHHYTITSVSNGIISNDDPSSVTSYGIPYRRTFNRSGAAHGAVESDIAVWNTPYERIDFAVPAGSYTESDLKALVKLRDNKIEIGMMFADAHKTASTFVERAVQLQKAVLSLKRGNLTHFYLDLKYGGWVSGTLKKFKADLNLKDGKLSKNLSKRWLETNFMVLPAMEDIYTLSRVYEDGFEAISPDIFVASKGKSTQQVNIKRTRRDGDTTFDFTEVGTFTNITKIFCQLDDYALKTLGKIGLDNPFVIAWDMIPWSFVVDWFLPIGNFIKAWSARLGVGFKTAYHATKYDSRMSEHEYLNKTYAAGTPYWYSRFTDIKRDGIVNAYKRTILDRMPIPNLYIKEGFMDLWKSATSLALLRSLLGPTRLGAMDGIRHKF